MKTADLNKPLITTAIINSAVHPIRKKLLKELAAKVHSMRQLKILLGWAHRDVKHRHIEYKRIRELCASPLFDTTQFLAKFKELGVTLRPPANKDHLGRNAKLSNNDKIRIDKEYRAGLKKYPQHKVRKMLVKRYNVSVPLIDDIVARKHLKLCTFDINALRIVIATASLSELQEMLTQINATTMEAIDMIADRVEDQSSKKGSKKLYTPTIL